MDLSVILGAYKEANNLQVLLPKLEKILSALPVQFEILVIDVSPSLDNTAQVCTHFAHVRYVTRQHNNSYGSMVRSGIKQARFSNLLFMDADGSHDPKYLPDMIKQAQNYDLVIGSRYIKGGGTCNGFWLQAQSRLLNWIYRTVLQLKVHDISNSFRCYRAEQLKTLSLEAENFDILEEILVKLQLQYPHLTIKEIPIFFNKRQEGTSHRNLLVFIGSFVRTMCYLCSIKYGKKPA